MNIIPDPLPKHPTADDVYYITGAWAPSCITAKEKRFTDAELAAEYWRAGDDMAEVNYDRDVNAEPIRKILLRFHSLPNYDEDDS